MTVAKIDLNYDTENKIKAFTEEQYEKLLNMFKNFPKNKAEFSYYTHGHSLLVDLEIEGKFLCELGIEFTIKNIKGLISLHPYVENSTKEQVVHVHVPNIALFAVNQVEVKENCCTEVIQEMLDEGWHILAICPPNDVRRPDYIMGKIKS